MVLYKGRPEDISGRLPKEVRVYDFLDSLGIIYERVDHEAAMTMEACAEIDKAMNTAMCKNLFLCNRQCTDFYLLMLPGDKIFINDETGIVYRNGEALDEPYVRGGFTPSMGLSTAYVVPEDGIFVLGDNRRESLDSRILRDSLKMEDVVGVVTFRLAPFESLRGE